MQVQVIQPGVLLLRTGAFRIEIVGVFPLNSIGNNCSGLYVRNLHGFCSGADQNLRTP